MEHLTNISHRPTFCIRSQTTTPELFQNHQVSSSSPSLTRTSIWSLPSRTTVLGTTSPSRISYKVLCWRKVSPWTWRIGLHVTSLILQHWSHRIQAELPRRDDRLRTYGEVTARIFHHPDRQIASMAVISSVISFMESWRVLVSCCVIAVTMDTLWAIYEGGDQLSGSIPSGFDWLSGHPTGLTQTHDITRSRHFHWDLHLWPGCLGSLVDTRLLWKILYKPL